MKVLVGKTFGIGNAVMAIPMLKALKSLDNVEKLDVLIGSTSDDFGAFDVFKHLRGDVIDHLWVNTAAPELEYDVAIMSIPFDGRWRNGVHFKAKEVMDSRTRPDPSTEGLVSWKKHEVAYQMDNAYALGYEGDVPSCSFIKRLDGSACGVYLGVGYKKDDMGFWKRKHWGNENFIELTRQLLQLNKSVTVATTGSLLDWRFTISELVDEFCDEPRFIAPTATELSTAFGMLLSSKVYVGNDTGMMHVAASVGIPCVVPFFIEGSIIKNRPWGTDRNALFRCWEYDITVDDVLDAVEDCLEI